METFEHLGETLRRLRKERDKTLAALGAEAKVGKGQLSRIENGHQAATLGTLIKILAAHGIGRRELFRRYDLVEAEHAALQAGQGSLGTASGEQFAGSVRQALDTFVSAALVQQQPLAQGTVDLGEYLVLFRVVARNEAKPAAAPEPPRSS